MQEWYMLGMLCISFVSPQDHLILKKQEIAARRLQ